MPNDPIRKLKKKIRGTESVVSDTLQNLKGFLGGAAASLEELERISTEAKDRLKASAVLGYIKGMQDEDDTPER